MLKYNIMKKDNRGNNDPDIFSAVINDDPHELALALQAGQTLDDKSMEVGGMTPIHYACYLRKTNFLKVALEHNFDPWIKDANGRRSIEIAMIQGLDDIQNILRDKLYPNGISDLAPEL